MHRMAFGIHAHAAATDSGARIVTRACNNMVAWKAAT
jgi:hypothetical protein